MRAATQQLAFAAGDKAPALAVKARLTRLRQLHGSPASHSKKQPHSAAPHGAATSSAKITSAALAAHDTVVFTQKQGSHGIIVSGLKV